MVNYDVQAAKEMVVEAGKKLVETGLIARTWGNVSARISDTQFVITPSGRAYETLTPEEIVVVNIEDCSHEGDIKPSSEKGIHADAYRLRPEVNFVIHTHQVKASVISAANVTIKNVYPEFADKIGSQVPCASYGMPSTGKLRKGVAAAVAEYPWSKAVIMKHHGALCMGADYDEAFEIASALEQVCDRVIRENYLRRSWAKTYDATEMRNFYLQKFDEMLTMPETICNFGTSERVGDHFLLQVGDETTEVTIDGCVAVKGIAPKVAKIHAALYQAYPITHIKHVTDPDIVAVSCLGETIKPMLDDFAQIAGPNIRCAAWIEGDTDNCTKEIVKGLKGRNAVFVQGMGAIATGNSESDVDAVELVMNKGCQSDIGAHIFMRPNYISPVECQIMRTIYVTKYSKKANEK